MKSVYGWLCRARARIGAFCWPARCVLCGGAGQEPAFDLCSGCIADLPRNDHRCLVCAEPLGSEAAADLVCGSCLRRPPHFDSAFSPYRYAYPVDHMIRRLKYGGALANGRVLGELLARGFAASARAAVPELLLPVPLGAARFRERGFNQAIVLAEHVHRCTDIALRTDVLVRTRETLVQAGLDQVARRKNIRGAFAVSKPMHARHVAVIDDVVTTASTVNEIARVLKRAGATRVDVWAVAKVKR